MLYDRVPVRGNSFRSVKTMPAARVGLDAGGTFTDVVVLDGDAAQSLKLPTDAGLGEGLARARPSPSPASVGSLSDCAASPSSTTTSVKVPPASRPTRAAGMVFTERKEFPRTGTRSYSIALPSSSTREVAMAQVETSVPLKPLSVAGQALTTEETYVVRSPWDGAAIAAVPTVGALETRAAIDAAADAIATPLPAHERAEILDRGANAIRDGREELARLLAREIGKPLKQALVEVDRCVQTLTFSAIEARTLAGRGVALEAHPAGVGRRGYTIRVPIGVVGAITPFNFPLNLAAHKIGPAIAAGCGVVLKPAEKAPLTAIELVRILHQSGLPPRWLSVIVGPPEEVAGVFLDDDRVRLIAFTGSSDVGWRLAAAAPTKRGTLELGNSTPVIVCADADLEAAAGAVSV